MNNAACELKSANCRRYRARNPLLRIEQLTEVLDVCPLTLLTVAHMGRPTPEEKERTTALLRNRLLAIINCAPPVGQRLRCCALHPV